MKTVEEVRRQRLAMLREEMGTLVALNDRIGLDKRDSTLSQILNSAKNSRTGKGKEMGSPMARKLEAACGKEMGWMDTDPALLGGSGLSEEVTSIAAAIDALPRGPDRDQVLRWCRDAIEMAKRTAYPETAPDVPPSVKKITATGSATKSRRAS